MGLTGRAPNHLACDRLDLMVTDASDSVDMMTDAPNIVDVMTELLILLM